MCMFSVETDLQVARDGEGLVIGPINSPHTGNRWFHRDNGGSKKDPKGSGNDPVCVVDGAKLMVRSEAKLGTGSPVDKLCVGQVVEFAEIRDQNNCGDFIRVQRGERPKLVRIALLPIGMNFEVVNEKFVANMREAGNAMAELKPAPEEQPVYAGQPSD